MQDIFSTTHQMTVLFITDKSATRTGFVANFTTGYHLGMPGEFPIYHIPHKNIGNREWREKNIDQFQQLLFDSLLFYFICYIPAVQVSGKFSPGV